MADVVISPQMTPTAVGLAFPSDVDQPTLFVYDAPAESAPQEGFVQSPTLTRSNDELARWAQLLLLCRRRRAEIFDAAMFNEAAWDGLLVLYMNERAGVATSAASLAEQVGVRLHLMMRWVNYLEAQGLVDRAPLRLSGRPGFVRLTDKGRCDLERYLSETLGVA